MITVNTKVSEELNNKLENLCKLSERNKGYFIRRAIEFYLHKKEQSLIAFYEQELKGATPLREEAKI